MYGPRASAVARATAPAHLLSMGRTMANVNVTYEQMTTAAGKLEAGQAEIEGQLGELKAQVDDLVNNGYVTDSSSKAFQQSYDEFNQGARQVIEGLTGMGKYLRTAAQTFEEADTTLANALKG